MKCHHDNCNGTLIEKPNEKTGPNVFECDSCHCVYRLTTVRKAVDCPSLKGVPKPEKTTIKNKDTPVIEGTVETAYPDKKRGRGRPKGSKNKKG